MHAQQTGAPALATNGWLSGVSSTCDLSLRAGSAITPLHWFVISLSPPSAFIGFTFKKSIPVPVESFPPLYNLTTRITPSQAHPARVFGC